MNRLSTDKSSTRTNKVVTDIKCYCSTSKGLLRYEDTKKDKDNVIQRRIF